MLARSLVFLSVLACAVASMNPPPAMAVPSRVPVPEPTVSDAWGKLAQRPQAPGAFARFLALLPALDAFDLAGQRERLKLLAARAGQRAPLVAARATMELWRFLPPDEARASAKRLGMITEWLAAGPFPSSPTSATSAHADLISGHMPTPDQQSRGLSGSVSWTRHNDFGPTGATAYAHLLRPQQQTAAHFVTVITLPRRMRGRLLIGAEGAIAVSLNGRPLAQRSGLRTSFPDQLVVPVALEAGEHVVAITVVNEALGKNFLYARLVDRRDRPLPVSHRVIGPGDAWPSKAHKSRHGLSRKVARARSSLSSLKANPLRLAIANRALGLADRANAAPLEDLLLSDEAIRASAGELLLALLHVPAMQARASLLQYWRSQGRGVRKSSPEEASLTLSLSHIAARQGQAVRARQFLAQSVSMGSEPRVTRLTEARIARDDRPARAWNLLGLHGNLPHATSERWLREAAGAAADLERRDRAVDLWRRIAKGLPSDVEALSSLAHALTRVGKVSEALTMYETAARARPDLPGYGLEAARTAQEAGLTQRARDIVSRLQSRARQFDADALEALGRLHERLGSPKHALDAYVAAIERRPTAPELRARIARLSGRPTESIPFKMRFGPHLRRLPSRSPKALFEVLSEEVHLEVQADGGMTRHSQRFVRVHGVPQTRQARTSVVKYDPSQEEVRILAAQVHRDGLVRPVLERESVQVSEAWYGLYYDQRELGVPFDDLMAGDIIEISYRTDQIVAPALKGAFDWIELVSERHFKHRFLLQVTTPDTMSLRTRLDISDALKAKGVSLGRQTELRPNGRRVRSWEVRNIPPVAVEAGMPGSAEVSMVWQATTHASWDALARSYQRLIAPQRVMTAAMQRWLQDIARTAKTPAELTRAIVEGITKQIRYVGLEFGIHGYQPYRTDQVWIRRFGDCKDQATLLTMLLGHVGIRSQVVLLRTRGQGRLPAALPALALFDHAIVYLPEAGVYVDPTVRGFGFGQLPSEDQGAQVLILEPSARLRQTTVSNVAATGVSETLRITISASGAARVQGTTEVRGSPTAGYREQMRPSGTRQERLEKLLNRRYPGLELEDYEVDGLDSRAARVKLTYSGVAPDIAQRQPGQLSITSPAGGANVFARLAADSTRQHALVVGPPSTYRFASTYVTPPGYRSAMAQRDVKGASPFGNYRVVWREKEGHPHVVTTLTLRVDQVEAGDYKAFRSFLNAFDAAVRPPLRFLTNEASP